MVGHLHKLLLMILTTLVTNSLQMSTFVPKSTSPTTAFPETYRMPNPTSKYEHEISESVEDNPATESIVSNPDHEIVKVIPSYKENGLTDLESKSETALPNMNFGSGSKPVSKMDKSIGLDKKHTSDKPDVVKKSIERIEDRTFPPDAAEADFDLKINTLSNVNKHKQSGISDYFSEKNVEKDIGESLSTLKLENPVETSDKLNAMKPLSESAQDGSLRTDIIQSDLNSNSDKSVGLKPPPYLNSHPYFASDVGVDAGFHPHVLLPGEAEIRYEPDQVSKSEHSWEAVLNMQPEEPSPGTDLLDVIVEGEDSWGAELHGDCDCWNTTEDGRDVEVECRCGGLELVDIPTTLASDVHRITVVHAGMVVLKEGVLQIYKDTLREIVLNNVRYLQSIETRAFQDLWELRTVYINHAPLLRRIPDEVFHVHLPSLRSLRIVHTGLEFIPQLHHLRVDAILHMVDLENNQIRRVTTKSVRVRTEQFLLNYNAIEVVENHAFSDAEIAKLSLKGNRELKMIEPSAFEGLQSLRELDLSETAILQMPTLGLKELEVLRLQDTDSLKKFPSIYNFEYLRVAWLTYPYHCCAFQFPATHHPAEFAKHERFVALIHNKYCTGDSTSSPPLHALRRRESDEFGRLVFSPDNLTYQRHTPDWGALDRGFDRPDIFSGGEDGVFHQSTVLLSPRLIQAYCGNLSRSPRDVACHPSPDAFNPCEDLMGNWGLRGAVWLVAVAALVGNLAVLLVLLSSKFRMTVPKFLMCNLALADLCMGIYLLLIACMDARSVGSYFNYAIDWQRGPGCQIAGFLTVFASELSIYTLTVITSERWYAITYALHLDKRLRLRTASKVMAAGWIYAITMATLPLLGISGYSKTSICLPMENRDLGDQVYLVSLLLVNGLAFILICACYGRIYCAISGHNTTAAQSDTTVAKRMALLVFTDFACWAPIAFFGLTAVAGYPLIDVPHTKILLVFFYPLNSCANPYLYALLTKQYRRDLFTLLSRHGLCTKKAARYKGADVGYSSGNSVPPNLKVTSIGGSGGCQTPEESSHSQQRSRVAPSPSAIKPRSGSADGIVGAREQHRGSPHPLRSSTTRLNLSSEQEMILRRVLDHPGADPIPVVLQSAADSHL